MGYRITPVRRATTRRLDGASARTRLIAAVTGLGLAAALLLTPGPAAAPAEAATRASSTGATTTAPFSAAPVPVITGTAVIGQRLLATTARWTPAATTSTYSWLVDGVPVDGQATTAYTVRAADAGHVITVAVTGSRSGYTTTTRVSAPTATVPTPVIAPFTAAATPTIAGTAQVGFTLTARAGTWTPWPTFSYAWTRDGVAIAGQTGATYRVTTADQGAALAVIVTGTKTGYATQSLSSAPLAVPAPVVPTPPAADVPFTAAGTPSITGIARVDYTLTAKSGTWTPWPSFSYAWLRDGVVIPDQTGPTYRVDEGDVGTSISVAVTGTKTGYITLTLTSAALLVTDAPYTPPPAPPKVPFEQTAEPVIRGSATAGTVLRAETPAWTPEATAYTYGWARDGVAVLGATGDTYAVQRGDTGSRITVTVTGSRSGYTATSRVSEPTAEVVDAVEAPPALPEPAPGDVAFTDAPVPTLTGTAEVGSTLTAATPAWTPVATTSVSTWARDGVVVPGRTGSTYLLSERDAGTRITVTVTGRADGVAPLARTSEPVAVAALGEGYDVVAILGQSNAQGVGTGWDPSIDVSVPGLDQLAGSGANAGRIVPAKDSLSHVTTWTTQGGGQTVGPGMELGRHLLAQARPGRKVLLVPAAMASTSMTGDGAYAWNPADTRSRTNLFTRALGQIDTALAQDPDNRLVAVVWAQGESDATRTTGSGYQSMLSDLVDRVDTRYGQVPFLIGGMVPEWLGFSTQRQAIDTAQQGMPALRPNVSYIPGASGFSRTEDSIHYTAAGARAMGDKYAAAYDRATGATPVTSAPPASSVRR